jgi:hypothetical protein
VAVPRFVLERLHEFVDGLELAECSECLDGIRKRVDDFQTPPGRC